MCATDAFCDSAILPGVQPFKVGGVALVVDFRPTGFAVFVLDEQPQVGAKVAVAQLCVFGTRLVRVCEENAQRLARCDFCHGFFAADALQQAQRGFAVVRAAVGFEDAAVLAGKAEVVVGLFVFLNFAVV